MFSITSYIYEPRGTVTYKPYPPLTIANYTAWTVVSLGAVLAVRYWRRIWNNQALRVLLMVIMFYVMILFVQNFASYLHTGEVVAVHGRYLVPVYPVLLLALAIGFSAFLEQFKLWRFKGLLVGLVLVLFLQGGGIIGWIVRSDPSWYWQQSAPAARANWLAKDVLYRVVHH
jgi:hypothetical protein